MALVKVKVEVYPDDTREGLIEGEWDEILGKEYNNKPDSLGGAAIHAFEEAMKIVRRGLWSRYPTPEEQPVEGQYYVGYPCIRGVTQILQAVADQCDVLSSIYLPGGLDARWAVFIIGPIPDDEKYQQEFEERVKRVSSPEVKYTAFVGQTSNEVSQKVITHMAESNLKGVCGYCGEKQELASDGFIVRHPRETAGGIKRWCEGSETKPVPSEEFDFLLGQTNRKLRVAGLPEIEETEIPVKVGIVTGYASGSIVKCHRCMSACRIESDGTMQEHHQPGTIPMFRCPGSGGFPEIKLDDGKTTLVFHYPGKSIELTLPNSPPQTQPAQQTEESEPEQSDPPPHGSNPQT